MAKKEEKSTVSQKILDILLLFREMGDHISIDEISHALAIPKSTVYRHVRILCDKGFLEKADGANYRLGLTFVELSLVALNSNRDIRLTALPSMKRIAEQVGELVSLMRVFNRRVVCIESIEGRLALRVTIERGRIQLLHTGASSKVLLAHLPEASWEDMLNFPLERLTDETRTDFAELREELLRIHRDGYAISDGEIDVGAKAIAVPLKNGRNEVVAALSIEAPSARMDEAVVRRYIDILRQEAHRIHIDLT